MKQKMFLCVSTMFLIMALAACSVKEPEANLPSVSQSFDSAQESGTEAAETAETADAEPTLVQVGDVVVTIAAASIRSGPGTNYEALYEAEAGVELERTGIAGDWSRVIYDGKMLYISNSMIEVRGSYEMEAASGQVTVTAEAASIRSGAGTTYRVLYTASAGETYTVTGVTNTGWYEIEYEGQRAYVYGDLVEAVLDDTENVG